MTHIRTSFWGISLTELKTLNMPVKPANWKSMNQFWVSSIQQSSVERSRTWPKLSAFFPGSWRTPEPWSFVGKVLFQNESFQILGHEKDVQYLEKDLYKHQKVSRKAVLDYHMSLAKLKYTFGFFISLRPGYVSHTCSRVLRRSCGLFEELAKTSAVKAGEEVFDDTLKMFFVDLILGCFFFFQSRFFGEIYWDHVSSGQVW